ncbi:MAG TPA: hypothetical protein VK699_06630 [Terriglobales bacterium]|jgi:hypothetical protein|nr:hypothetical protein [Terriglobales bacterium]
MPDTPDIDEIIKSAQARIAAENQRARQEKAAKLREEQEKQINQYQKTLVLYFRPDVYSVLNLTYVWSNGPAARFEYKNAVILITRPPGSQFRVTATKDNRTFEAFVEYSGLLNKQTLIGDHILDAVAQLLTKFSS